MLHISCSKVCTKHFIYCSKAKEKAPKSTQIGVSFLLFLVKKMIFKEVCGQESF